MLSASQALKRLDKEMDDSAIIWLIHYIKRDIKIESRNKTRTSFPAKTIYLGSQKVAVFKYLYDFLHGNEKFALSAHEKATEFLRRKGYTVTHVNERIVVDWEHPNEREEKLSLLASIKQWFEFG